MMVPYTVRQFLAANAPATPCVILDLDAVATNYTALHAALPVADIYYAVKANPAPEIIARLAAMGAAFDTASRGEIDLCLAQGAAPQQLSFGNTIKKEADIAYAFGQGVRLFAFDSEGELEKLARAAPGAQVFCRILVETVGAEWPLSRKFGCTPAMARQLLLQARFLGLEPVGVSFHVGSQQTDCRQWDIAIAAAAGIFNDLAAQGIDLTLINLGGGMPAQYLGCIPPVEAYGAAITQSLHRHFGALLPRVIIEPGRSLVGDAGTLVAEVVLVSRKDAAEAKRWVYLDAGKFNGLAETMDESIKYRLVTDRAGATGPVVLAGPTCDSADIMYEKTAYELPLDLAPGDLVYVLSAGAYTTSYASVAFNGFAPVETYCVGEALAAELPLRRVSRAA